MAFSKYPEICHEKVMFQSLKSILSYLESFQDQIATQGFTLPWTPDFVDDCLVRLVYLIHEPNRTSDESFSFNPKNYLARITDSTMLRISDESGLKLILIRAASRFRGYLLYSRYSPWPNGRTLFGRMGE